MTDRHRGFHIWRGRQRRDAEPRESATVIGEYATYRGDLAGAGSYLVHGRIDGDCDIEGDLVLGPTAHWYGDIAATRVVIAGEVTGDVYASAKLELQATARIHGNITSPVIVMTEGAIYDGDIRAHTRPQTGHVIEKRSI